MGQKKETSGSPITLTSEGCWLDTNPAKGSGRLGEAIPAQVAGPCPGLHQEAGSKRGPSSFLLFEVLPQPPLEPLRVFIGYSCCAPSGPETLAGRYSPPETHGPTPGPCLSHACAQVPTRSRRQRRSVAKAGRGHQEGSTEGSKKVTGGGTLLQSTRSVIKVLQISEWPWQTPRAQAWTASSHPPTVPASAQLKVTETQPARCRASAKPVSFRRAVTALPTAGRFEN